MNNIEVKDLKTERLLIKRPTIKEQYALWNILKMDEVNKYYFPTPDRIFSNNNLNKANINDLKRARTIFMEEFRNWDRQKSFYEKKISAIINNDNSQKYTWSIFLKSGEVIGQITVQPKSGYENSPEIRDIGWFINPKYQRQGYATEAATAVLNYMFNETGLEMIITSSAIINTGSWKIMEKLGFKRICEKITTYFDENDNILYSYCYQINRKTYIKKNKVDKIKSK